MPQSLFNGPEWNEPGAMIWFQDIAFCASSFLLLALILSKLFNVNETEDFSP